MDLDYVPPSQRHGRRWAGVPSLRSLPGRRCAANRSSHHCEPSGRQCRGSPSRRPAAS